MFAMLGFRLDIYYVISTIAKNSHQIGIHCNVVQHNEHSFPSMVTLFNYNKNAKTFDLEKKNQALIAKKFRI
jgi:hypothetical protein